MRIGALLPAMLTGVWPLFAQQGYVTLATTDNSPFSSFTNSTHWSDNQYPHGDADYLVFNGLTLRTPENNGNYAFGGRSLTLSNGFVNVKGGGQLTVADLRTYSCRIADGIGSVTPQLYGTNTVCGTASGYSRYSGSNDRTLALYTVFQGSGELSFDRTEGETPGSFYAELRGDNTAFTGGMRVVGPNIELRAVHTNGLGGALAAFRADALSLVNSGALYVATSMSLGSAANRGVSLSNGGILRVASPNVLSATAPVAGTGSLVIRGDGRVDLDAALSYTGDTAVEGGTLRLGASLTLPQGHRIVMKSGARTLEGQGLVDNIRMEGGAINPGTNSAAGLLSVSNLVMSGGVLRFDFAPGGASDFIRVTGTLSNALATPIPIALAGPVTNECPAFRRLLTAPNLGDFAVTNFSLQYDLAGLPEGTLDLLDESGVKTLVFRQARPVIIMSAQDGTSSFTVGDRWSDGLAPTANNDYLLIGTALLRTPGTQTAYETFPGRSLSMTAGCDMRLKGLGATVQDMRLYSGRITQGTPPNTQYLFGSLAVFAPPSAPFNFEIEGDTPTLRQLVIGASLTGSGDIRFRQYANSSLPSGGLFALTNLSTAFTGGINVNGFRNIELGISDERNLGGAPAAFRADQLKLTSNGVLFASSTLTIDDPNRGVTLDTVGGILRVETNNTLTVAVPISGPGKLTQRGAGTLVLSGANSYRGGTAIESNATLEVRSPWALGSNAVSFAQNTTLRIPRDPAELPLGLRVGGATPMTIAATVRIRPLFADGERLPKSFDLPLFLLMQAAAFNTAPLILEGTPVGYTTTLATRTVTDGAASRTQVFAHYVFAGTLLMVQ